MKLPLEVCSDSSPSPGFRERLPPIRGQKGKTCRGASDLLGSRQSTEDSPRTPDMSGQQRRSNSFAEEEAALESGTASYLSIGAGSNSSSGKQRSGVTLPVRSRATNPSSGLPASSFEFAAASFSQDVRDIREGSYRLGSLALSDDLPSVASVGTRKVAQSPKPKKPSDTFADASFGAIDPASLASPSNAPSALAQSLQANDVSTSPESNTTTPRVSSLALPSMSSEDAHASPSSAGSASTRQRTRSSSLSSQATQHATPAKPAAPVVESTAPALRPLIHQRSGDERQPLLPKIAESASPNRLSGLASRLSVKEKVQSTWQSYKKRWSQGQAPSFDLWSAITAPIPFLPSTLLGILMNLLDGVSYGLIMFPKTPQFLQFGGISVSMFVSSTLSLTNRGPLLSLSPSGCLGSSSLAA